MAATTESSKNLDLEDEPVWRFLAAVAVCADPQEQQDLVTAVRDKVLENVSSAKKLKVTPEVAALKIVRSLSFIHDHFYFFLFFSISNADI